MARTAEENNKNDVNFLNNNLLQRTNPDASIRSAGDKEFEVWFNSPVQQAKYSPDKLQKKMDEYEYLKNETLINLGIKNSPLDVLLSREEIIEQYGPQKGAMYLRKAENAFLSAAEEELLANDKKVNTREFNQITLFTELGNRIIDEDNRPTIDEIHDLRDNSEINSAQYDALIDLYTNPDEMDDKAYEGMYAKLNEAKDKLSTFEDDSPFVSKLVGMLGQSQMYTYPIYRKLNSSGIPKGPSLVISSALSEALAFDKKETFFTDSKFFRAVKETFGLPPGTPADEVVDKFAQFGEYLAYTAVGEKLLKGIINARKLDADKAQQGTIAVGAAAGSGAVVDSIGNNIISNKTEKE